MTQIANSTFFDMTSYQLVSDSLWQELATVSPTDTAKIASILNQAFYPTELGTKVTVVDASTVSNATPLVVGLTLDRAEDPTTLLASDWATRQLALANQSQVWQQYGADPSDYVAVQSKVQSIAPILNDVGYVSTSTSRTIWLELTPDAFKELFGTPLLQVSVDGSPSYYAWAGNLSLDESIAGLVDGLWVQQTAYPSSPAAANSAGVTLDPSLTTLGQGNGAHSGSGKQVVSPSDIAAAYHFPLPDGSTLDTPTVGLVEGGTQDIFNGQLFEVVNLYRQYMGLAPYTSEEFFTVYGLYSNTGSDPGELTLDVSVIADAAPNSSQVIYASSGQTYYTSYQQAFFDFINNPSILSSSYPENIRFSPDSPFQRAYYELFVDAQLRNMSVFLSSGDGGSGTEYGTGLPLVRSAHSVPNAVIVGGTSLVSIQSAESDATLAQILDLAQQNDPSTLLALTAAGLTALPQHLSQSTFQTFTEAVWNDYVLLAEGTKDSKEVNASQAMGPDYTGNNAGTGGVDDVWDAPSYQTDFGLSLSSAGPNSVTGRGIPDVSILAGGDTAYEVIYQGYDGDPSTLTTPNGGTSAATPFWASLTAQIDAIFNDQGLPNLGYYNDLLYISAAISPAAFNDVTLGNNTSTYYYYAYNYNTNDKLPADNNVVYANSTGSLIVPTGIGYYAAAGYDLATGLGSPNGTILARTLANIAHMQMDGQVAPDVVTASSEVTAVSDAGQTLLVQASGNLGDFSLSAGGQFYSATSDASELAWTSRLAGQVMQSDFDPALVQALDGAAQTQATTLHVNAGDTLFAAMGNTVLGLYQTDLTSSFGFAAFGGLEAGVTVARPVAVAQTVGGADDQEAVVRIRQNGQDSVSVTFYKVDDLSGTIDGVAPGASNYATLAAARAYHTSEGGTSVAGPGWGEYTQTILTGVDSGDLIAMKLSGGSNTYWAFSPANESVNGESVTHLWSYGLNTWGWEDLYGGGDQDYNDLVVQLDFTSTAGSGLLI